MAAGGRGSRANVQNEQGLSARSDAFSMANHCPGGPPAALATEALASRRYIKICTLGNGCGSCFVGIGIKLYDFAGEVIWRSGR